MSGERPSARWAVPQPSSCAGGCSPWPQLSDSTGRPASTSTAGSAGPLTITNPVGGSHQGRDHRGRDHAGSVVARLAGALASTVLVGAVDRRLGAGLGGAG